MTTTINKIINKLVNLDNNIFSFNYDKNDNIQGIHKIFFYILYNLDLDKKYINNFEYIKETLDNFYFIKNPLEKNCFFDLFCKIIHVYNTLNRFVFLYKYKKSKLVVETDLQLNKINENDTNVICIYHISSKYLFKIEDLLKLIYVCLTNCFCFLSEPIVIRNPYNNLPFGKSILYYINSYLVLNTKIKFIKSKYLDIFFKFRKCNFNITEFLNNYEYILREYAIQNYFNNSTKKYIINDIKTIINSFNYNFSSEINKINISEEFPQDELIKIMKPYLLLELQASYSLVEKNRLDARKKLRQKLFEFQRFNPHFGRKIFKFKDIVKNGKIKRTISHFEFVVKHKKFNIYEIENFMKNHLEYKYEQEFDDEQEQDYEEEQDEDEEDEDEEDEEEQDEEDQNEEEQDYEEEQDEEEQEDEQDNN